jgi:hypothetical protein
MTNWSRHDTRALIEAAGESPRISIGAVRTVRRHHGEDGLVERMARFERFMAATNATPHIWGVSDCSLMVADWVKANGYGDPAENWRRQYASEAECNRLLLARGGLSQVAAACAMVAGLKSILEPEFGCVAAIGSPSAPERQFAAIWNGHRWMVRWLSKGGPTWAGFIAPAIGMWRV